MKEWPSIVKKRKRVYGIDAKSIYDYLSRDGTTTSTDKRVAIQGAFLKETMRRPNAYIRWIDGLQNIADILTKAATKKGCTNS